MKEKPPKLLVQILPVSCEFQGTPAGGQIRMQLTIEVIVLPELAPVSSKQRLVDASTDKPATLHSTPVTVVISPDGMFVSATPPSSPTKLGGFRRKVIERHFGGQVDRN